MRSCGSRDAAAVILSVLAVAPAAAWAQSAQAGYTQALAREQVLRTDLDAQAHGRSEPLLARIRTLVREYEQVVRRYPGSGYSDNALYQAAVLSADAYWHYGEETDRRAALRLFRAVRSQYPTSSLNARIPSQAQRLEAAATPAPAPTSGAAPLLMAIRREALPDALRVTLELEREAAYYEERLEGPARVFVDLRNTATTRELSNATLAFSDDVVRQIRIGHRTNATRVVLDLEGDVRHSVYALYNPYRVVIDFERPAARATTASAPSPRATAPRAAADRAPAERTATSRAAAKSGPAARETPSAPASAEPEATWPHPDAPAPEPPAAASANSKGRFSLSRQLGLGISRVAIDPGHGGHDPGAHVKGLNEADLTLDVALRLEALLLALPGVEVVLTRRTNVYVPLEERTAIANRAGADLFLSIHANASRNLAARGIETYFLNFAQNPEAEAIAARENAGSARTMGNLPDIVKAIALNNKIDESRDFAAMVQAVMYERLRKTNREARNLGVKQAPFMVLIGATMPSILAEISFLTNRQEGALLRTPAYRQAIAEALFAGVSKYQRSLKAAATTANQ